MAGIRTPHLVPVHQIDALAKQDAAQQAEAAKQRGERDCLRERQPRRVVDLCGAWKGGRGRNELCAASMTTQCRTVTSMAHGTSQHQLWQAFKADQEICARRSRQASCKPEDPRAPHLEAVCEVAHAGAVAVGVCEHHHLRPEV